jgi:hypothetical protein
VAYGAIVFFVCLVLGGVVWPFGVVFLLVAGLAFALRETAKSSRLSAWQAEYLALSKAWIGSLKALRREFALKQFQALEPFQSSPIIPSISVVNERVKHLATLNPFAEFSSVEKELMAVLTAVGESVVSAEPPKPAESAAPALSVDECLSCRTIMLPTSGTCPNCGWSYKPS